MSQQLQEVRENRVALGSNGGISPTTISARHYLLFGLVLVAWLPRLVRSFWVDETATFWMAHHGPLVAIERTWHWPGHSILYSAVASLFCFPGPFQEVVLRLPTVAGIILAGFFLYRLAEETIGKGTGFIALLMFWLHPFTVDLATQARPYGLAIGAAVCSMWSLYRWVECRERRFLVAFAGSCLLVVYLHYFFFPIFFAHAIYLWLTRGKTKDGRWGELILTALAVAVLTLPLLPHVILLFRQAHTLPAEQLPGITGLVEVLLPSIVGFGAFAAAVLLCVKTDYAKGGDSPQTLARPIGAFFAACWLIGPLLFFCVTIVFNTPVFGPRYVAYAVPAQCLLLTAAGTSFFGALRARTWSIVAVLISTANPIYLITTGIAREALQPIMKVIQAESGKTLPPVFFRSRFTEADCYNWRNEDLKDSYLYAPFTAYPISNRVFPLPFHLNGDARRYVDEALSSELVQANEAIFVTHEEITYDASWIPWMTERMRRAGFEVENTVKPNSFIIVIFKRTSEAAHGRNQASVNQSGP